MWCCRNDTHKGMNILRAWWKKNENWRERNENKIWESEELTLRLRMHSLKLYLIHRSTKELLFHFTFPSPCVSIILLFYFFHITAVMAPFHNKRQRMRRKKKFSLKLENYDGWWICKVHFWCIKFLIGSELSVDLLGGG